MPFPPDSLNKTTPNNNNYTNSNTSCLACTITMPGAPTWAECSPFLRACPSTANPASRTSEATATAFPSRDCTEHRLHPVCPRRPATRAAGIRPQTRPRTIPRPRHPPVFPPACPAPFPTPTPPFTTEPSTLLRTSINSMPWAGTSNRALDTTTDTVDTNSLEASRVDSDTHRAWDKTLATVLRTMTIKGTRAARTTPDPEATRTRAAEVVDTAAETPTATTNTRTNTIPSNTLDTADNPTEWDTTDTPRESCRTPTPLCNSSINRTEVSTRASKTTTTTRDEREPAAATAATTTRPSSSSSREVPPTSDNNPSSRDNKESTRPPPAEAGPTKPADGVEPPLKPEAGKETSFFLSLSFSWLGRTRLAFRAPFVLGPAQSVGRSVSSLLPALQCRTNCRQQNAALNPILLLLS
mmetsp:Transcript_24153/g.56974  ORF Transcript_24153/g.56974 Transcript_24153/m.56974 type:complete len:412 (-) Transcript_24153:4-1239(-)